MIEQFLKFLYRGAICRLRDFEDMLLSLILLSFVIARSDSIKPGEVVCSHAGEKCWMVKQSNEYRYKCKCKSGWEARGRRKVPWKGVCCNQGRYLRLCHF